MKKRFLRSIILVGIALFVCTMATVLSYADDSVMNKVEILEKVDSFENAVHHYNLNDFFEDGEIKYIEYQLVSAPYGNEVSLDQNVLTITPKKSFDAEVKIGAKDREGEITYLVFNFRFIEASSYIKTVVIWTAVVLLLLLMLLLWIGVFMWPLKRGTITYKTIANKEIDYRDIDGKFPPVLTTSSRIAIRGYFMGCDECLKFVAKKNCPVYIKDIIDEKEKVIRIKSYPLYPGEDNAVVFYSDRTCSDGVKIIFR